MICIAHDDAYSKAVEWLKNNPRSIYECWNGPSHFSAGILFRVASRSGKVGCDDECGCLTQVRAEHGVAETPELTAAIRADQRIPKHESRITRESLEVFAAWQRHLDSVLGRTPPVWVEPDLVEV